MATGNPRDIALAIGVTTPGIENIDALRKAVGDLAKGGGDAAPEFARLATELDKITAQQGALATFSTLRREVADTALAMQAAAAQVDRLGAELPAAKDKAATFALAQREAGETVKQTAASLLAARNALRELREETPKGSRNTDEYRIAASELRGTIDTLTTVLRTHKGEYKGIAEGAKLAAAAERESAGSYKQAETAARSLSGELGRQNTALTQSRETLREVGLSSANLVESQRQIRESFESTRTAIEREATALSDARSREVTATRELAAAQTLLASSLDFERTARQVQAEKELAAAREKSEASARRLADAQKLLEAERTLSTGAAQEKAIANALVESERATRALADAQRNLDAARTQGDQAAVAEHERKVAQALTFSEKATRELAEAQRALDSSSRATGDQRQRLAQAEIAVADARTAAEQSTRDLSAAERTFIDTVRGGAAAIAQRAAAEKDLAVARDVNDAATRRLAEAQKLLAADRATGDQDRIATRELAVADARRQSDRATRELTTAQQALNNTVDAVRTSRQAVAETELATARTRNEAATRQLATAQAALEAARTTGDQTRVAQQERAVAEARRESEVATRQLASAQRTLDEVVRGSTQAQTRATAALQTTAGAAQQLTTAYRGQAAAATAGADSQVAANTRVASSLEQVKGQLAALRNIAGLALGGSIVGTLAADVGKTADAYANLAARIRIATGEGPAFDAAFQGVFDIAQRTGTAVQDVGALFTKLSLAGKHLNLGNADTLKLVEAITQATQLSGATAESSASAITQFAQALAGGALRGDELNSVLEQSPRLAQALADGLGITTGELRKLGEAGALTASQVITALQGQSQALQKEFDQLPPTIGRAITSLSNNWTEYIGQVDKANGVSAAAATAITALGKNLDFLGTLLFSAGKAALAYQAIRLAQGFFETATVARASAAAVTLQTTALVLNTTAATANAVAQRANAGAIGEVGAAAGRFASVISTIKLVSLVGVVTNLREIGTAIGEGAAKLLGYGKAIEQLEISQKADAEAARANASAKAALAQQMQAAADKALGLSDASKKLVVDFDGVRQKGESVSDALKKLTKDLELGDLQGIANAGAALDALALKGKISGQQIRDSLSGALNGVDLGVFETQARAAFDTSEQGARRLKAALDAIAGEALKRAGTSLGELKTGFSTAANAAINDVDAIVKSLDGLGIKGDDAGRALSKALDKAIDAATTERAVKEVGARVEELGKKGLISGEQFSNAMEKVRQKVDDLTPGVQSLSEAAKKAGVDLGELTTGVGKGFKDSTTALSDLNDQIVKAGISAEKAGPLLATAIDQRIAAAKTREELDLLASAVRKIGTDGKLTGEQTAGALDKIKQKAQELNPVLKQAQEDAKRLGVDLKDNLQKGAEGGVEGAIRAYERLKSGGKASADELRAAFVGMAQEVIRANGGIVPEWLKVEAATRGAVIAVDEYGNAVVKAAKDAKAGLDQLAGSFGSLYDAATKARNAADFSVLAKNTDKDGFSTDSTGNRIVAGRQVNIPEGGIFDEKAFLREVALAARTGRGDVDPNRFVRQPSGTSGAVLPPGFTSAPGVSPTFTLSQQAADMAAADAARRELEEARRELEEARLTPAQRTARERELAAMEVARAAYEASTLSILNPAQIVRTPLPAPLVPTVGPSSISTVNIAINGGAPTPIKTATPSDAAALVDFMTKLEQAARSAGFR